MLVLLFRMLVAHGVLWLLVCTLSVGSAMESMPTEIRYPVKLLSPVTGDYFFGTASRHHLTCFGNQQYREATYLEALACMSSLSRDWHRFECFSLWGSRNVIIQVNGSVELLRMNMLPREEKSPRLMNATHWAMLMAPSDALQDEVRTIQAAPIYLCARSVAWHPQHHLESSSGTSTFQLEFRPAYLRQKDRDTSHSKFLLHLLLVYLSSFAALCPALAAASAAVGAFTVGLNHFIVIAGVCASVLLSTPIMVARLRSKHDLAIKMSLNMVLWRVYGIIYVGSVVVVAGSMLAYLSHEYLSFCHREHRNNMLRASLAAGAAYASYHMAALLHPAPARYGWLLFAFHLSFSLRQHINANSRNEVFTAIILITWFSRMLLRIATDMLRINTALRIVFERLSLQKMKSSVLSFGSRTPRRRKSGAQRQLQSPPAMISLETATPVLDADVAGTERGLKIERIGPITLHNQPIYIPIVAGIFISLATVNRIRKLVECVSSLELMPLDNASTNPCDRYCLGVCVVPTQARTRMILEYIVSQLISDRSLELALNGVRCNIAVSSLGRVVIFHAYSTDSNIDCSAAWDSGNVNSAEQIDILTLLLCHIKSGGIDVTGCRLHVLTSGYMNRNQSLFAASVTLPIDIWRQLGGASGDVYVNSDRSCLSVDLQRVSLALQLARGTSIQHMPAPQYLCHWINTSAETCEVTVAIRTPTVLIEDMLRDVIFIALLDCVATTLQCSTRVDNLRKMQVTLD